MQQFAQQYFDTTIKVINSYSGLVSFAAFLKNYFSQNKKHGSKDRKAVTQLCYSYLRLGKSLPNVDTSTKLKVAYFLCNPTPNIFQNLYSTDWLLNWQIDIEKRIAFIQISFPNFCVENIFPHASGIGNISNKANFIKSHLQQPKTFIRIRPNMQAVVLQKLQQHKIDYTVIADNCLALNTNTELQSILLIDKEVVVQDYSSQQVQYFFQQLNNKLNINAQVWDCCAASGGKSILAADVLRTIRLTVTDVRESILFNLKKRFHNAGIFCKNISVQDLTKPLPENFNKFNLIICDAPCSGSGTWGRTPEQLVNSKNKQIEHFSQLQKQIVEQTIRQLKPHGYFLYITCSIYTQENEDIVDFIAQNYRLRLIEQKYFEGYTIQADTMFGALFQL